MFLQQMRLNKNKNQNERRDNKSFLIFLVRFHNFIYRVYDKIKGFFFCIMLLCIFVQLSFASDAVFYGKGFHVNIDNSVVSKQCTLNVDVVFDKNKNQIKETALEVSSIVEDYLSHLNRKFGLQSTYSSSYTDNTVNVIVTGDKDVCDKAIDEASRLASLTGDLHE